MNKAEIKKGLEAIVGINRVFDGLPERLAYRWGNVVEYRIKPPHFIADFVVQPKTTEEVSRIVKLANKHKTPIVPWGGGTDFTGANSPVKGGIVLDLKGINHIEVNAEEQYVKCGGGAVLVAISDIVDEAGYLFPHEITTQQSATIGGSIATNAYGIRSASYRSISNLLLGIEVVLPTGEIVRTRPHFKTSMGYGLPSLLIGSEGTLGVITEATLRIIPKPQSRKFIFFLFPSLSDGLNAAKQIASNLEPEFFDFAELSFLRYATDTNQYLKEIANSINGKRVRDEPVTSLKTFIERFMPSHERKSLYRILVKTIAKKSGCPSILTIGFEGSTFIVDEKIKLSKSIVSRTPGQVFIDETYYEKRFSGFHDTFREAVEVLGSSLEDKGGMTLDIAIPPTRIMEFQRGIHEVVKKHPEIDLLDFDIYSSMSTIGIDFLVPLKKSTIHNRFFKDVKKLILSLDGSLSFAHGIGMRLLPHVEEELDKSHLKTIKKIKKALDPNGTMNPGKLGDAL